VSSIPDHLVPRRLRGISGVVLAPHERAAGCRFAARCALRVERCEREIPALERTDDARAVRCFRWEQAPPLRPEPLLRVTRAAVPALLEVHDLTAVHRGQGGERVVAASGVTFSVGRNECVALVGESGSGKTTIARCVAGLHSPEKGALRFDGELLAPRAQRRSIEQRRRIQIVFQNPSESLNPRHRVGDSIARPAVLLRKLDHRRAALVADSLLEQVRLPAKLAVRYPGELSGGEQQRVAIARALAAEPELIICDEVTSALDVSVQAAVLALLDDLRQGLGLAILFVSHDLGVVASIADRAIVLERGAVREEGPTEDLLQRPSHPYTRALVDAAPRISEGALDGAPASGVASTGGT
jgi:peptide/nickel transport system ATP-binding protein